MPFSSPFSSFILLCLALLFLPVHSVRSSNKSSASTSTNSPSSSTENFFTIEIADAVKFVQEFDIYSRSVLNKSIQYDQKPYQKEINKIHVLLKKRMYNGNFINIMVHLQKKIDQMNTVKHNLSEARQIADIERDQVNVRFKMGDIQSSEYDHPSEKFNIIERILEAQFVTICRFFLDKFLEKTNENSLSKGKLMRVLEINDKKCLDIERYERKREQFDLILKSGEKLIKKKLAFFNPKNENDKENSMKSKLYKMKYTEENYLDSIQTIERELGKIEFKWPQNETEVNKVAKQHFWTISQRPKVRQTLWVVRHAPNFDNESAEAAPSQDEPLSERGKMEAENLKKWFEKLPISKMYASPFQRTLQTAVSLRGTTHPNTFINIEPGLGEFLKPCDLILGYKPLAELYKDISHTNPNYWPVYSKKALELIKLERDERGEPDERDCHFAVAATLRQILKENKNAEAIVLVTHRDVVGYINQLLSGEWAVVDTATVSKYVQYTDVNDGMDIFDQFVVEYSGLPVH